jgi:integrase/recombinase XerD
MTRARDVGLKPDPQAQAAIDAFCDQLWLRDGLAQASLAAYRRDLGAWAAWLAERKAKMPELLQPLRCALSGRAGGPDCFDMIAWLGRERALARIEHARRRLA